ncbi:hypothetical protein [uncultured Arcobacter sp.]|uniref:hypothetical protein n=1 Tax=uncultured Arcobacter sp. TaxID=165434 RepID=UPI00261945B0|nr:hypothetical protein [uncultured Arcobacter sp.]
MAKSFTKKIMKELEEKFGFIRKKSAKTIEVFIPSEDDERVADYEETEVMSNDVCAFLLENKYFESVIAYKTGYNSWIIDIESYSPSELYYMELCKNNID